MILNRKALLGRAGKSRGFTLLELMVVVVVIAILTAVAYPSYRTYIVRANRSAAQTFMLEVASKQERYLLDARTYAADMTALGVTIPPSVSANYNVTTAGLAGPPPTYTITADPTGKQATDDTECGRLTLDQANTKGENGTGTVATCWKQ